MPREAWMIEHGGGSQHLFVIHLSVIYVVPSNRPVRQVRTSTFTDNGPGVWLHC